MDPSVPNKGAKGPRSVSSNSSASDESDESPQHHPKGRKKDNDKIKGDRKGPIFERRLWIVGEIVEILLGATSLPFGFHIYKNRSVELDRRYSKPYLFSVSEMIDKLVGDQKKDGREEDK